MSRNRPQRLPVPLLLGTVDAERRPSRPVGAGWWPVWFVAAGYGQWGAGSGRLPPAVQAKDYGAMLRSMTDPYSRFEIARPDYLGDDHWACVEREADRLWRSLVAGDGSQSQRYQVPGGEYLAGCAGDRWDTRRTEHRVRRGRGSGAHAAEWPAGARVGQSVPVRPTRHPGQQDREEPGQHPERVRWRARPSTDP